MKKRFSWTRAASLTSLALAATVLLAVGAQTALAEPPRTVGSVGERVAEEYLPMDEPVEEDGAGRAVNHMTAVRKRNANALLKKHKWKESSGWYASQPTNGAYYDIAAMYGGDHREEINAAAKKIGLSGVGERQEGLVYARTPQIPIYQSSEGYVFTADYTVILDSNKKDAALGAYINLYYNQTQVVADYLPLNTSAGALQSRCKDYAKNSIARSFDDVDALDFLPGIRANEAQEKAFVQLFQEAGWTDVSFKVFRVDRSYDAPGGGYFNREEAEEIKALSMAYLGKNGGEGYYNPDGGLTPDLYAQRRLRIKGFETPFYVTYYANREYYTGGMDTPSVKDFYAAYILVRPGVAGKSGKPDRLLYPADATAAQIGRDMQAYYKRNGVD